MRNRMIECLDQYGLPRAEDKADLLLQYMDLVLERNRQVNLTAITSPEEFIEKHYVDSLSVAALEEFKTAESVIDLGTGAGFPGIPLAIAFPEKRFVLADSLDKRIRIIREFCDALGIANVEAVHGRAEDLGRRDDLREHFDLCVSRAVADLRVLAEYCLPFVKAGGAFVAYKGPECENEVREAEYAIGILGGQVSCIADVRAAAEVATCTETAESASGASAAVAVGTDSPAAANNSAGADSLSGHRLVVILKAAPTPDKYPRRAGLPGKKPLQK